MAESDQHLIHVGISRAFHNKELRRGYTQRAWGDSFAPSAVLLAQLVKHVLQGGAFTPGYFQGNTRKNETLRSMQVFGVDLEDHNRDVSVADALAIPFVRDYAFLVHPSASSGKVTEKNPNGCKRTRILFCADQAVEGVERARAIARAICEAVGLPYDEASFKPAQPYFGSTNTIEPAHINLDAVLPIASITPFMITPAWEEMERNRAPKPDRKPVTGARAERYAERAYDDELRKLATAAPGTRNKQLYDTSKALYSMALGNWPGIDSARVTSALEGIVSAWEGGRVSRKTTSTITSGQKHAVARDLALPDNDELPADVTVIEDNPHDLLQYHPDGVPDSFRSLIMRYIAAGAPVYELYNRAAVAKLINPDGFTRAALAEAAQALGIEISYAQVCAGIKPLEKQLFAKLRTDIAQESVRNSVNNSAGRRDDTYSALTTAEQRKALLMLATPAIMQRRYPIEATPDRQPVAAPLSARALSDALDTELPADVAADLEQVYQSIKDLQPAEQEKARKGVRRDYTRLAAWLRDTTSAPLPDGWRMGSVKDYRTAVLRAWKLFYSDADWLNGDKKTAAALGMTPKTLQSYLDRAGVDVEHDRTEAARITSPRNIEREVTRMGYELKGRPLHFTVKAKNGRETQYAYSRESAAKVADYIADGAEVYAVYQVANLHVAREDATPPPVQERQKTETTPMRTTETRHEVTPDEPRRRAPGYKPEWVHGQLELYLKLLGYRHGTRYVNADGETAPLHADTQTLLELLIGRSIAQDSLFSAAIELGAVITPTGKVSG